MTTTRSTGLQADSRYEWKPDQITERNLQEIGKNTAPQENGVRCLREMLIALQATPIKSTPASANRQNLKPTMV
jgi:hypothetical protein